MSTDNSTYTLQCPRCGHCTLERPDEAMTFYCALCGEITAHHWVRKNAPTLLTTKEQS